MSNHIHIDSLLPTEMAQKAEDLGLKKANLDFWTLFALSVLAGAFIGLGAVFATTVSTGGGELPYGVNRLITGVAFCLGLILVIVGGAELFTGNTLIIMGFMSGKVPFRGLILSRQFCWFRAHCYWYVSFQTIYLCEWWCWIKYPQHCRKQIRS